MGNPATLDYDSFTWQRQRLEFSGFTELSLLYFSQYPLAARLVVPEAWNFPGAFYQLPMHIGYFKPTVALHIVSA